MAVPDQTSPRRVTLRHVPRPPVSGGRPRPAVPGDEYERRLARLAEAADADWVVVYGDREHNANLAFFCGFDPRFEEALLLVGPGGRRCLVVGNEGMGYVPVTTVPLDAVLAQSLSLMGQRRSSAPRLAGALHHAGIGPGARVAVVGWKYLEPEEDDDITTPAWVPALLVRVLQRLVGPEGEVRDATHVVCHPEHGLKSHNTAAQIAQFAWAAERASQAVFRIVDGARPGMTELDAAGHMGYQGEPLSCHVMMVGGDRDIVGLCSPGDRVLQPGDGVTTAIGYWGSLSCRAGLLTDTPVPSFVEHAVVPYFRAIAAWWESLRPGVTGDTMHGAVMTALAGASFGPALNPGHLIAIDEWTHTPIRPGSHERLTSGMMLQCDIIPSALPPGQALNCEDTVALADAALRAELAAGYPDLWRAIQVRRALMHDALGLTLDDSVLPLSPHAAYLPPFWMAGNLVCTALR
jgi:hypothetical protein